MYSVGALGSWGCSLSTADLHKYCKMFHLEIDQQFSTTMGGGSATAGYVFLWSTLKKVAESCVIKVPNILAFFPQMLLQARRSYMEPCTWRREGM